MFYSFFPHINVLLLKKIGYFDCRIQFYLKSHDTNTLTETEFEKEYYFITCTLIKIGY